MNPSIVFLLLLPRAVSAVIVFSWHARHAHSIELPLLSGGACNSLPENGVEAGNLTVFMHSKTFRCALHRGNVLLKIRQEGARL